MIRKLTGCACFSTKGCKKGWCSIGGKFGNFSKRLSSGALCLIFGLRVNGVYVRGLGNLIHDLLNWVAKILIHIL